jgi:hypothetical protein
MLKTRLVFLVYLESALPYVNSQCILWKYNACECGHYIFVKPVIVFSHDTQWVSDGYPLGIMGNPKPFDFYGMLSPWGMGFTRIRPTLGSISQGPYSCKALERLTLLGENWSNFVSVCGGCITLGKISATTEDGTSVEGASSPSLTKSHICLKFYQIFTPSKDLEGGLWGNSHRKEAWLVPCTGPWFPDRLILGP